MKASLPSILAALILATTIGTAHAALLAGWDFSTLPGGVSNFGPSPLAATTTLANTSNTGIIRGSGIGTTSTFSAAERAWGGTRFDTGSTSYASAVAASDIITVSFDAAPGFMLSFSDVPAYNVRRSLTGPTTGQWAYQVGGSPFVDLGSSISWGTTITSIGNPQAAIPLGSIVELQNVAAGTTVTFRLATWGATNFQGTFYLNDPAAIADTNIDFSINGDVAIIPEPNAAAAIIGVLGLLAILRRR